MTVTLLLRARDEDATRAIAGALASALARAFSAGTLESVVIGLRGELGAGKTAFTRGFMAGLDPAREDDVASPTYAIVQLYDGDPPVRHLDLYRLESARDLEAIGFRDLFFSRGIALVEWIDRVPEAAPAEGLDVHLAPDPAAGDDARRVMVTARGDHLSAILDGLSATVLAAFA